jgi:hypothetical protein
LDTFLKKYKFLHLFRVNLELTAITNDGLTEELEAQNALLMEKLKYIAQLELELDQLKVQCNTLDGLMMQSKDERKAATDKDHQGELRQEVQRLSLLLEEKTKALEELTTELESQHQQQDQQQHQQEQDEQHQEKNLTIQELQQENRSLTAQVEQLGRSSSL